MVSKKTFLSKHLYLFGLRRFRVAGVVYLLLLLALVPYSAYTAIADTRWSDFPVWNAASELVGLFDARIEPFSPAIFSLVMVLLVFSYLFQARSANMLHSLPANRTTLFRSGIATALTLMWVPQLIAAAAALIPIAVSRTGLFWLAAWWFAAEALMTLFFTGLASVCVMCAGRAGSAALFYVILNFLYAGIRFIANSIGVLFVYGIDGSDVFELTPWFLTPVIYLMRVGVDTGAYEVIDYEHLPRTASQLVGLFRPESVPTAILYALAGAVLVLIAYVIYRRRRVETAGSFLSIECLKPVFKIGAASGVALGLTCIAVEFEQEAGLIRGTGVTFAAGVIQTLVFGLIVYFIAEMLIRRSVRVFTKKQWLICGVFSVCIVVLFILIRVDAFGIERRVPQTEACSQTIMTAYGRRLETDDPEEIRAIHRMILEDREEIRGVEERNRYYTLEYEDTEQIRFIYVLNNGSVVRRSYTLDRLDEAGGRVMGAVDALVDRPEHVERMLLDIDLEAYEITGATMTRLIPTVETDEGDPWLWFNEEDVSLGLSARENEDLLAAVRQDIAEGHLSVTQQDRGENSYANRLELIFASSDTDAEYRDYYHISLNLNPSCTHTIEAVGRSANFGLDELITWDEVDEMEREFAEG